MPIDVNCDLGEYIGEGRDIRWTEQLMKYITSCNIACGFHAGDPYTIFQTIELAKKYNVSIGAHPSYPDIANFGRKSMDLTFEELMAVLTYQISALMGMVKVYETKLTHVKPHGALYHDIDSRIEYTKAFYEVIAKLNPNLVIFGPPAGFMEEQANAYGFEFVPEAFADRMYTNNLTLQNRSVKGAIIIDPDEAFEQVKLLVYERKVLCNNGKKRKLEAKTICVHGDNPSAVMILQRIRSLLHG